MTSLLHRAHLGATVRLPLNPFLHQLLTASVVNKEEKFDN